MKLRSRVFLTTAGVALPPILGLVVLDGMNRHEAAAARLAEMLEDRLSDDEIQAICAEDPARITREHRLRSRPGAPPEPPEDPGAGPPPEPPGPPPDDRPPGPPPDDGPRGHSPDGGPPDHGVMAPTFTAYAEDRSLSNPPGHVLPELATDLSPGAWAVLPDPWYSDQIRVVGKTTWASGPCTWVLVEGSTTPGFLGAILPPTYVWLTPVVAVLGTLLFAIGPVVRRVRRLTRAVEAAPHAGFVAPDAVDDELGQLASAFGHTHAALQDRVRALADQDRAMREHLANTTHDVMIPLTVLQGHLANLRDRGVVDPALTGAIQEVHYVTSLLKNLGAVARLDMLGPRWEPAPVELGALIARVVARHRPVAEERAVQIEAGVPPEPVWVSGDVTLLEQAVGNLVDNALRYNRPDGHVAVVLEVGAGEFELSVLDDGPGVDEAELPRLAARGVRLDAARSRAPGGLGLGLDITRRVMELHAARLSFGRSEAGGLAVTIRGARLEPGPTGPT